MQDGLGSDPSEGNLEAATPEEGTPASSRPDLEGSEATQGDWNLTVDGKSFTSPQEAQAHIEGRLSDKDSYIDKLEGELSGVRGLVSNLEGRVNELSKMQKPAEGNPNSFNDADAEKFWENPGKYLAELEQKVEQKFNKALADKETEVSRNIEKQRRADEHWASYYEKNSHHKEFKDTLVQVARMQLANELPPSTPLPKFFEKLSGRVNDMI